MWMSVEELTDYEMRQMAANRVRVRLATGYISTLIRWPGGPGKHSGRYARLETRIGSRFSVSCAAVAEVEVAT